MPDADRTTVMPVLTTATEADRRSAETLLPEIYEDLRARAAAYLAQERADHTLQPTGLAHEAYIRVIRQQRSGWESREHFLAIAAILMRRILIDHARQRGRVKRGGAYRRCAIELSGLPDQHEDIDLISLNEALKKLAAKVVGSCAERWPSIESEHGSREDPCSRTS